jgi:hypothetical protein
VYALLGIASDTTDSSDPILPDYTKSLSDLILDVVRNQHREQIALRNASNSGLLHRPDEDRIKQTNNLTTVLCSIMGVSRMELVAHIFHKAPRIELEIHEILSATRTMALLDSLGTMATFVPFTGGSMFQLSPTLRDFVSLITQDTERLDALQRYLNSPWSYAAYRPCSAASAKELINQLLEFREMRSNPKSRRHRNYSNTRDRRNIVPDFLSKQAVKLRDCMPKRKAATEKTPIENYGVFYNSLIIGIANTPISKATPNGLCVVSCRGQEQFGAALLVECGEVGCERNGGSTCKNHHSYRIVTTGFFCRRELGSFEN